MKALFIIDMLYDYVYKKGVLYVPYSEKIIPIIKKTSMVFRKTGLPVFYINDAHKKGDKEFEKWPEHALKGTKGAEVILALNPRKNDIVIEKSAYSGFSNPKLKKRLRELNINEVYMAGVVTHVCVENTALDALNAGFKVKIIKSCIWDINNKKSEEALKKLEKEGAEIITEYENK